MEKILEKTLEVIEAHMAEIQEGYQGWAVAELLPPLREIHDLAKRGCDWDDLKPHLLAIRDAVSGRCTEHHLPGMRVLLDIIQLEDHTAMSPDQGRRVGSVKLPHVIRNACVVRIQDKIIEPLNRGSRTGAARPGADQPQPPGEDR